MLLFLTTTSITSTVSVSLIVWLDATAIATLMLIVLEICYASSEVLELRTLLTLKCQGVVAKEGLAVITAMTPPQFRQHQAPSTP